MVQGPTVPGFRVTKGQAKSLSQSFTIKTYREVTQAPHGFSLRRIHEKPGTSSMDFIWMLSDWITVLRPVFFREERVTGEA